MSPSKQPELKPRPAGLRNGALEQSRRTFNNAGQTVAEALAAGYLVPEEKLSKVVDYAIGMLAKNPRWAPAKIARKTAEYFKLPVNPQPKSVDHDDVDFHEAGAADRAAMHTNRNRFA
ncbi:hypothetical protein [Flaviaesturariibacter amylovorans]|uniref:Uncharacterized protein n=1 Tax=Flaviaesturariibacter amylovorans TaxID=1084520 RepID=A0ABP8GQF2_9BACT